MLKTRLTVTGHMSVSFLTKAALALLLLGVPSSSAQGQTAHTQHKRTTGAANTRGEIPPTDSRERKGGRLRVGTTSVDIPDLSLLDQNGKRVRFYSDLFKGKVVVLSFFFTSCTYVCPMQGAALSRLKSHLGERLGKDVFFVSVTKDPETDTPERLRLWGNRYGAGRGWTLVTGEREVMRKLVMNMTGEPLGTEMHQPVVVIGSDKTGTWMEAPGLSTPEQFMKIIEAVSAPPPRPSE